jgi:hypothetical protein
MCTGHAAKCYLQAASGFLVLKLKPGEHAGFFSWALGITKPRRLLFLGLEKRKDSLLSFFDFEID